MIDAINSSQLTQCVTQGLDECSAPAAAKAFRTVWTTRLNLGQAAILGLPALIGVFIGAPLFARELEQGTHVLAFTQSVSRIRWMSSKILVSAGPALAVVAVLQLLVEWWVAAAGKIGPLASGPYFYATFGSSSLAPLAYTL